MMRHYKNLRHLSQHTKKILLFYLDSLYEIKIALKNYKINFFQEI